MGNASAAFRRICVNIRLDNLQPLILIKGKCLLLKS